MKLLKVMAFLLLPFAADLAEGCCGTCKGETYFVTNCSINTRNIDNVGATIVLSQNDSIKKEAYGIQLQLTRSTGTCYHHPFHFSGSAAYAIYVKQHDEYTAKDNIKSIVIKTLLPFDAQHTAGADVTEYFRVFKDYIYFRTTDYTGRTDNEVSNLSPHINLLLMTPPPQAGAQQFEVTVQLSDGRNLVDTTNKATLL